MAKAAAIVAQRCHELAMRKAGRARPLAQDDRIAALAIVVAAHHSGLERGAKISKTTGFGPA
jgi:hypothetical protein